MKTKKIDKRQLASYIFWGCLTSFVNFSFYIGLTRIFTLSASASNLISWAISVIFAYITNKLYVFNSKTKHAGSIAEEFFSFALLRMFSGLVETAFIYVFADVKGHNDITIKIIGSIFVVVFNYIASKWIVFDKRKI